MNRLLVWDGAQGTILLGGSKLGTYAPHVFDNSGNDLGRLPTNVEDVPGALADISEGGYEGSVALTPDFGHYVFSSIKVPFAPGGLAQEPGSAYDNDIDAETVTVISRTEGGADIPKDPAVGSDYIRIPAVSNDGSHILMSTRAPGNTVHLYMRVNNAISYDISVDQGAVNQGVKFEGMTSDGSSVYFTTNKQMSADDTDTSIDLYMWSEATQALARVSDSGNLPGDTDACSAGWTSKCNVEVVPVSPVEFKKFDSAMAREAGDVYFYSPEQLDGARGVPGGRNLFVYRDGSVQHVATLANSAAATRINVSADGAYMALISSSQLTPYDNAGFRQMYRYDADARHVMCASCRPDGEAPTAHVEGSQNGLFMTNDGRAFFAPPIP